MPSKTTSKTTKKKSPSSTISNVQSKTSIAKPKAKADSSKSKASRAPSVSGKPSRKTIQVSAEKPLKRSSPAGAGLSESPLVVGQPAPAFTLPDDSGKVVNLSDFRGKKVVLYFYPKDDTPGCTREACDFRDGIQDIRKKGAVVFGVSADSVSSHRKFSDKFQLNFPLLSDESKAMLQAYGVWKEKSLYGRKFMGIERTTVLIKEDGTIARVFPKVKVDGHFSEVLKALNSSGS
jgi:thioredoxin-dependent peroxiredoxin